MSEHTLKKKKIVELRISFFKVPKLKINYTYSAVIISSTHFQISLIN